MPKAARIVIYVSSTVMTILLVRQLAGRGGPYFDIPPTVYDHVSPGNPPLTRNAILISRKLAPILPRGATVTVIAPELAPNYDVTHYLTAAGFLSHQQVVHPTLGPGEQWPDYIVTLGRPLDHPGYRLVRQYAEGWLYQRE